MVSEYTLLSFKEVNELDVFEYWLYLRDSFVYKCKQTEHGLEYLEKCSVLEQTKPDRKSLREKFGKD